VTQQNYEGIREFVSRRPASNVLRARYLALTGAKPIHRVSARERHRPGCQNRNRGRAKAAGDLKSITWSGSAKDVAFEQCGSHAADMQCRGTHDPMRPITNYVRVINNPAREREGALQRERLLAHVDSSGLPWPPGFVHSPSPTPAEARDIA
jgi:hypothetical protein